jgi:hypothetical protein
VQDIRSPVWAKMWQKVQARLSEQVCIQYELAVRNQITQLTSMRPIYNLRRATVRQLEAAIKERGEQDEEHTKTNRDYGME